MVIQNNTFPNSTTFVPTLVSTTILYYYYVGGCFNNITSSHHCVVRLQGVQRGYKRTFDKVVLKQYS
jgi:hypothetical protein